MSEKTLTKKRKLDEGIIEKQKVLINKRKEERNENQNKFLQCITFEGKTTAQILNETGLHRDTVHIIGRELMKQGRVIKVGKFGKYRLTEVAFMDPGVRAWRFHVKAIKEILTRKVFVHNKFIKNKINAKVPIEEEDLFVFSVKIGALITYILLKATRPTDLANQSESQKDLIKDQLSKRWVEDAINPYHLMAEFRKLGIVTRGRKPYDPKDSTWSINEMVDKKNYNNLILAFKSIYPAIFPVLEEIYHEQPLVMKYELW